MTAQVGETRDFWARRKAAVQAESEAEQATREAQALAQEQAALEEKSDAELLAELDLPDPDTLKMGDDFSAFMAKAVPDRIRRRALRVLWRSNPVLANVDMLVDYGEDFTDSATVVENMQTAYQIGKGMLKHVQEMARQAEAEEAQEDQLVQAEEADAPSPDAAEAPPLSEEAPEVVLTVSESAEEDAQAPEPLAPPNPRRMKFTTEESTA